MRRRELKKAAAKEKSVLRRCAIRTERLETAAARMERLAMQMDNGAGCGKELAAVADEEKKYLQLVERIYGKLVCMA